MLRQKPALSTLLPPIILGGGAYNTQMNTDPSSLPIPELISKAFSLGINAIDTSPYYGPSEELIGDALSQPSIASAYPRDSYLLITKAGRISEREFDYSPAWIRASVQQSCKRLGTDYLDVVFCHDVEFVTADEAIRAVECLFGLVDQGVVRYVGISGYPHALLADLAVRVREEFGGRRLDAVQSYCHFNLQNSTLAQSMRRLAVDAAVDVVLNASPLGMKLLSGRFPGTFHPAPKPLLEACLEADAFCREKGETLPRVAMRWVFANWNGPTVSGASTVEELDENVAAYRDAVGGGGEGGLVTWHAADHSRPRLEKWEPLWEGVVDILGEWKDYSWDSPPSGWVFKTGPS